MAHGPMTLGCWALGKTMCTRFEEIDGGYLQQHVFRLTNQAGEEVTMPACVLVTVHKGKIGRIEEYLDPSATPILDEQCVFRRRWRGARTPHRTSMSNEEACVRGGLRHSHGPASPFSAEGPLIAARPRDFWSMTRRSALNARSSRRFRMRSCRSAFARCCTPHRRAVHYRCRGRKGASRTSRDYDHSLESFSWSL